MNMLNKRFYQKSRLKIAGSLALCAVISGTIPVYGADTAYNSSVLSSNIDAQVESTTEKAENNSDILINSRLKEFSNLDKVRKYTGFDYKVPDYTAYGASVQAIRVFNETDGSSKLELQFSDKGSGMWYSIEEFTTDPVETLTAEFKESFENVSVTTSLKNIAGVDGQYITLTDSSIAAADKAESCKYFVWKNDNVWYCINYDNNAEGAIDENEIKKIADSLKSPSEAVNVSYVIDNESNYYGVAMSIYDKDDLNKACQELGYTPKLPLKINDNVAISDAFIDIDEISGRSVFSYYSNDKGTVVFIQTKDHDNYQYADVADTGYARENGQTTKVKADKLSINGLDVYRYADSSDNKIVYQWKENEMYYFFEIYYNNMPIENADDIVKEFVEAGSVQ